VIVVVDVSVMVTVFAGEVIVTVLGGEVIVTVLGGEAETETVVTVTVFAGAVETETLVIVTVGAEGQVDVVWPAVVDVGDVGDWAVVEELQAPW